jgi:hypothetical protein
MAYNFSDIRTEVDGKYIEVNKDLIMKDAVLGEAYGDTIPLMAKQFGVKGTEAIHPTTVDASLQDVSGCGFNAQGGLNISERLIETKQKKVEMEFCDEELINKFINYKVSVGAEEGALPFEGELIDGVVKSINKQVEADVWNIILNELGLETKNSTKETTYERIMEAYMAIPEDILDEAVIFVSPAVFREFVAELVAKNLYHYNPSDGDLNEIFVPGAGVKVRKARGIQSKDIFATNPKNLIYGTDFINNKEEVKLWYSDDNGTYRLKVRFNYGVQVAFPDLCVKYAPLT